ncbi:MAG: cobalamin biosynthesis protein [Alphaproteobacteria bacterium]
METSLNFYNPFSDLFSDFLDFQRIPYALAAVFLSVLLGMISGPLAGNANPLFWAVVDRFLGGFGVRMDKKHRPAPDLMFRGFIISFAALGIALLYIWLGYRARWTVLGYGLTETLFLTGLITTAGVWRVISGLYVAMEEKKTGKGGYLSLARTSRSNLTISDDFGISRLGIGLSARAFDKGLVAPVFWYVIGGIPLATLYAVFAALCWRFNKDGHSKGFGAFPAALERLLGFIPSLIAALLIILSGLFTPTANPFRGLKFLGGLKNRATYEQGGFPLSAMAWTLNVSLGGPYQDIEGSAVPGGWVGPAGVTAKTDHKNLRRALFISIMAHALVVLSLCGLYLL